MNSTPPTSGEEAREAVRRAERKLEATRRKTSIIDRVASSLRKLGEENNFSRRMRDLYREEP